MRLTHRGKRRLLVLLLLIALAGVAILAVARWRDVSQTRLVERARTNGLAAHAEGRYEAALPELGYALRRNRNDLEGLLALADCRARVISPGDRHLGEAATIYEDALEIDSSNEEALAALLELYPHPRVGKLDELPGIADRLLAIDASSVAAWSAKAGVAFRAKEHAELLRIADRLSTLEPQHLPWRQLQIAAHRGLGHDEGALIELCDQWIAEHETDGRFRLFRADLLFAAGELDRGRQELAAASLLGADSRDVLDVMLGQLEAHDLSDEASALIQGAKERFEREAWIYEVAVQQHWRLLRYSEALHELDEAEAALGPLETPLLRWKALLLRFTGEPDRANEIVLRLLALAGDEDDPGHEAQRKWAEALQAYMRVTEAPSVDIIDALAAADPGGDDVVLRFLTAHVYQRLGEHELALTTLRQAGELDRRSLAVRIAAATSFLALGQPEDAFKTLTTVIERTADVDLRIYVLLARAWLAQGDRADTIRLTNVRGDQNFDLLDLLQELDRRFPGDPDVVSLLADVASRRNRLDITRSAIERALGNDHVEVRTLVLLTDVDRRWGLGFENQLIERARSRAGLTLETATLQARSLVRRKRVAEALALIAQAVDTADDPAKTDRAARPIRIELLLASGQDATGEMTQWLRDEPSLRAASFVLDQSEAWEHPDLIKTSIDVLKETLGAASPRALLADATYRYRFESDDPESISSATTEVLEVLQQAPESKSALTLMASVLMIGENPNPKLAIDRLRRAVRLYPADAGLYPPLVFLLQQEGDFTQAGQYLADLARYCGDDAELRRIEAELRRRQGDYAAVIAYLSGTVDETSSEFDQVGLASLYLKTGHFKGAETILTRLLLSPQCSAGTALLAAEHFINSGDFDQGLRLLQDAELANDAVAKEVVLASYYQAFGRSAEAREHLDRAYEGGIDTGELWDEVVNIHLTRNELEEAREAAERGLGHDPTSAALQLKVAVIDLSMGDDGQRRVDAILQRLAASNAALVQTIRLYRRIWPDGAAIPTAEDLAEARRLVSDYPRFVPAWRVAVAMHARAGEREAAVDLCDEAMARLPGDPGPAEIATQLLIDAGQAADALDLARAWRQRSLANPIEADTVIASLLIDLGSPDEALEHLRGSSDRIWDERDRFPERLQVWLTALFRSDRRGAGLDLTTKLASDSDAWRERCLQMADRLDHESAKALISVVEDYLPDDASNKLKAASAWVSVGDRFGDPAAYERAWWLAQAASEAPGLKVRATGLSAAIAIGREDFELAERLYRSILEAAGDHVGVLNNLAYVLVRQGGRCDEAVMLAQRAERLAPDDPNIVDTLAAAFLCAGDPASAEQWTQTALAQQPDCPALRSLLAQVRLAQGRDVDARIELERANDALAGRVGPRDREARRRIESLERLLGDLEARRP